MTGNNKSPDVVKSVYFSNDYLAGPLSWIVDAYTDGRAANAPIKAIWRNEIGTAASFVGHPVT